MYMQSVRTVERILEIEVFLPHPLLPPFDSTSDDSRYAGCHEHVPVQWSLSSPTSSSCLIALMITLVWGVNWPTYRSSQDRPCSCFIVIHAILVQFDLLHLFLEYLMNK